jgi:ABC-type sugar transport system substrate-binding protein
MARATGNRFRSVALAIALAVVVTAIAAGLAAAADYPGHAPVVVVTKQGGFHWLDAMVGFAGGAGAALAAVGTLRLRRGSAPPDPHQRGVAR